MSSEGYNLLNKIPLLRGRPCLILISLSILLNFLLLYTLFWLTAKQIANSIATNEQLLEKPTTTLLERFVVDPLKCPKLEAAGNDSANQSAIKVAVCVIGTGAYASYVPEVIRSARRYLLSSPPFKRVFNVTYVVFTSYANLIKDAFNNDTNDIRVFFKAYQGWPWDDLYKYSTYLNHSDFLQEFDFVFSIDAGMRFVDEVGGEILGDLVGGLDADFDLPLDKTYLPYERRPDLCAWVPYGYGKHYFRSKIFGGRASNFLSMMCYLHQCLRRDFNPDKGRRLLASGLEEAYLNRFFIDHPPTVLLSPAYVWPVYRSKPPFRTRIELSEPGSARFLSSQKDFYEYLKAFEVNKK